MRTSARTIVVIMFLALLRPGAPIHGGPLIACPTEGASPPPINIGHFSEGAAELGEFCRYLVRNRIWPVFQDLGRLRDAEAAQRVRAALEAGTVDVLWLSTSSLGKLGDNVSLVLKVLAVTDFPVIHVVSRDPSVRSVTDTAFAPPEVMVKQGRAESYADELLLTVGVAPRCLESRNCEVDRGEGLTTRFVTFLNDRPSRVVVLAPAVSSARFPDGIMRGLLHQPEFHLVGIPPATVLRMQAPVRGTMTSVPIPRGYYGISARPDVPVADVPTAAVPMLLSSGTPAEVAERVRGLVTRVNEALLRRERRISTGDLKVSLEMVRTLGESTRGQIVLHEEYARILRAQDLLPPQPPTPIPVPPPITPPLPTRRPATPAPVTPAPPTPRSDITAAPPPVTPGPAIPTGAPPLDIRTFTPNPPVIRLGGRARLCWLVLNAGRARIEPEVGDLGPVEIASGCRTVAPKQTTAYTLRAWSRDNRTEVRRRTVVSVQAPPAPTRTPTPPSIR